MNLSSYLHILYYSELTFRDFDNPENITQMPKYLFQLIFDNLKHQVTIISYYAEMELN